MSSHILRIRLFGDLQLTYNDRPISRSQTEKIQSLLAYLVLHRGSAQARQRLAFLFWPDVSASKARANLRQKLFALRQALPEADRFIDTQTQTVGWRAEDPVWLDVEEFETAIARAEAASDLKTQRAALDRAIELYRGDLLSNCDDEWLSAERQRLSQLMMQALEQSISVLERAREYRAAIARAQHLLKLDALYEPGYKALMRLHVRLGDRASALQVYHQCMTQLREELGIDPSADMQTLYQHLLEDREPAVALSPIRSEEVAVHRTSTVGRDRGWQVMQQWLSASSSDLLLLLGEPGIGKTRMLEELAALVKSQGGTVLWGRGYAAELLRPYGAWIDALRSVVDVDFALRADLPDELGALLPELGLPDAAIADRGRLFDAVTTAIGRIAEQTSPIVAIFDDMQWLDEASVALLHYALRVLRGTRVRFACSARSQNVADHPATATFVQALRRDRAVRELLLEPLDKIAIRELVSRVDGVARESVTEIGDRIHTDSGGNPLLAIAAARTLGQNSAVEAGNVVSLVGDRLRGLSETASALLPWAAALGHSFDPMVLLELSTCTTQQLFTDLDILEKAALIRASSYADGYEFAHDLVRQNIYQQISPPRQRLMHHAIADRLHQSYANDAAKMVEVFHHAAIAKASDLASKAALVAARHSLTLLAFSEAAELAQQGWEHCQTLELHVRVTRQLDLLNLQVQAGVPKNELAAIADRIRVGIREARALDLQDAEATGQYALLVLNHDLNQFADLHHHSLEAADRARAVNPVNSIKLLAIGGACLASLTQDMARAEAMLEEAESLANRFDLRDWHIYQGLGAVHRYRGRSQLARDYLAQALEVARVQPDCQQDYGLTLQEQAAIAVEERAWDEVGDRCRHLIPLADKLGMESEAAFGKALHALADYACARATIQDVELTTRELYAVDAQRKLAFVSCHLAAIAIARKCPGIALEQARAALQAALVVDNHNDVALARAVLMQSTVAAGELSDVPGAIAQIQAQLDDRPLSHGVTQQLERLLQHLVTLAS